MESVRAFFSQAFSDDQQSPRSGFTRCLVLTSEEWIVGSYDASMLNREVLCIICDTNDAIDLADSGGYIVEQCFKTQMYKAINNDIIRRTLSFHIADYA